MEDLNNIIVGGLRCILNTHFKDKNKEFFGAVRKLKEGEYDKEVYEEDSHIHKYMLFACDFDKGYEFWIGKGYQKLDLKKESYSEESGTLKFVYSLLTSDSINSHYQDEWYKINESYENHDYEKMSEDFQKLSKLLGTILKEGLKNSESNINNDLVDRTFEELFQTTIPWCIDNNNNYKKYLKKHNVLSEYGEIFTNEAEIKEFSKNDEIKRNELYKNFKGEFPYKNISMLKSDVVKFNDFSRNYSFVNLL